MSLILLLIAVTALATPTISPSSSPTGVATPTPTFSDTPPAFVYQTPAPAPTPVGKLVLATAIVMHGQPIQFTEMEPNVEVYVNGIFQGDTNDTGSFTITFPNPGHYVLQVGDYPAQRLNVQ